jgi:hypothetical protein
MPGQAFLDYQHVDAFFVYSFLWTAEPEVSSEVFSTGLGEGSAGWISPLIHVRSIASLGASSPEQPWNGVYQPTFVLKRRCLEKSGFSLVNDTGQQEHLWLVVPQEADAMLPQRTLPPSNECEFSPNLCTIPVRCSWTIRLFDTGAGTFTCRLCPQTLEAVASPALRFSIIHWLLRLAPNIDNHSEASLSSGIAEEREAPSLLGPTNAFLHVQDYGTCRLYDLVRSCRDRQLATVPAAAYAGYASRDRKIGRTYADDEVLSEGWQAASKESKDTPVVLPQVWTNPRTGGLRENQTPYTFVTAIVSEDSMRRVTKDSSFETCQELASICSRLTLENRYVSTHYTHVGADYLARGLQYDPAKKRLENLCLDERVFFTLTRRGAIVITSQPSSLPAIFVVPSLLNLLEILRARLLSGIALSARLSGLARGLEALDPASEPISPKAYARYRKLMVSNLDDPLQYLFDGGSVTDLAIEAEKAFLVSKVWRNVERSFEMVDRLLTAWQTARFRERYG